MAAVAIVLACVQASAMALANAACCCRMPMAASAAQCPMHDGAAMGPQHHHDMGDMAGMDGMTSQPAAPVGDATCHFGCRAMSSMAMVVTPGVPPLTPLAIAVSFVPSQAPPLFSLLPIRSRACPARAAASRLAVPAERSVVVVSVPLRGRAAWRVSVSKEST